MENFITTKKTTEKKTTIQFKKRNSITGIFVKGKDYEELKEKNFWRIVTGTNIENYNKTQDLSLARIFSGLEMVKLS
ncbi:MAG: short-chain dehydrogenase [Chitinophagaceae bacterium]|nr:short-chain dehydrogenase [Chitinophagaceae bacterium]